MRLCLFVCRLLRSLLPVVVAAAVVAVAAGEAAVVVVAGAGGEGSGDGAAVVAVAEGSGADVVVVVAGAGTEVPSRSDCMSVCWCSDTEELEHVATPTFRWSIAIFL
jgi:NAD(P)H-hydrate repair Nnr-like enzyme with NAD(P)H-hydrate epimerase domain